MELGRASIYILITMMCINAVSAMMGHIGIEGVPATAWNQTQFEEAVNPDPMVMQWAPWQQPFWDIGYGLITWWQTTVPVIEAFPAMLDAYGCPGFIYSPIFNIWRFMWITTIALVIISGRRL